MTFFQELTSNQTLMTGVTGWVVAQVLKTILDIGLNHSFNPERLIGSGGMPSSHSSTVCSLATAAALRYGVGSFEFSISFILAMVVMYDAIGVRQETGKQARVLNRLLFDDFIQIIPIPDLTGQLRIQRIKRRILLLAAQITLLPLHAVREIIANRIRDFFIILIVRRRNIGFIRGFAGGRVRLARLYA